MNRTLPAQFNSVNKLKLLLCILGGLIIWGLQFLPILADGSIAGIGDFCIFHQSTHLPCPFCGMTRSLLCLVQGNWQSSLAWHPLGPFLGIGAAITFLAWLSPSWQSTNLSKKLPLKYGSIALSVLFISCWALRLAGVFPLPT